MLSARTRFFLSESPFRFPSPRERDRVTNLQRLFSYAVEFHEVRNHIRWLIDRAPNRFFTTLFKQRQTRGIRRGFCRAFQRGPSVDVGTVEHLERACRDLKLEPPPFEGTQCRGWDSNP